MFESFSYYKESPIAGIPVVPNGTWYAGHLHLFQEADFEVSMKEFSVDHADDHGRCTFWMGPTTPGLSVTNSRDVQTLLKVSSNREVWQIRSLHMQQFFGKYNLDILTGDEWKVTHVLVAKALHSTKVMKHNQEAVQVAVETLTEQLSQQNSTSFDDIGLVMRFITLDALGWAVVDTDLGCCGRLQPSQIMKDLDFMSSEVTRRMHKDVLDPTSHIYALPTPSNQKHQQVLDRMHDFLFDSIDERRELMKQGSNGEDVPNDWLTTLLGIADNQDGDNQPRTISDEMLVDIFKGLLFSSYEPTSVALTYVMYLLAKHPEAQEKCVAEIHSESVEPLYLEAVVKEALRIFPPHTSTTRLLEREVRFGGIQVPKGMYLYVPIWLIQRSEENFPDPLAFLPERWVRWENHEWRRRDYGEEPYQGIQAGNPTAFVAFSAGARSCAGQQWAMKQMGVIVSELLLNFRLDVPRDFELTVHQEGFVQTPKGGIPMTLSKRT